MSTADKAALARAAHEAALAIIHDVVFDVADGDVSADPNDYAIAADTRRGRAAITFVPGVEPGSVDVVLVAANGATARIRGRVFMRG